MVWKLLFGEPKEIYFQSAGGGGGGGCSPYAPAQFRNGNLLKSVS